MKNTKSDCYARVVLLSDSMIDSGILKNAMFSINETVPFRFLGSTVNTSDYNILTAEVQRSNRFDLYKKGSVFYFENEDNLKNFVTGLDGCCQFFQIGYNAYIIFNNTKTINYEK
jgi:hypothetical protein